MKKQFTFRLEPEVMELVDVISKMYSRLTMTDIVDIALKKFIQDIIPDNNLEDFGIDLSKGRHDSTIGQYMRGELDNKIRKIYEIAKKKKKLNKRGNNV